jgi:hypothetical protein
VVREIRNPNNPIPIVAATTNPIAVKLIADDI